MGPIAHYSDSTTYRTLFEVFRQLFGSVFRSGEEYFSSSLFYWLWSDAQVVVPRSRDLLRAIPQARLFLFRSSRISPQCLFCDIPSLTACSVSIRQPVSPRLLKWELSVGSSKKKKKKRNVFFCQLDVKHWVPYSPSRVPVLFSLPWPGELLSPHLKLGYFHGNDTKSSSEKQPHLFSLISPSRFPGNATAEEEVFEFTALAREELNIEIPSFFFNSAWQCADVCCSNPVMRPKLKLRIYSWVLAFSDLEAFLESKVTLLGIGALPGSEPRTNRRQR